MECHNFRASPRGMHTPRNFSSFLKESHDCERGFFAALAHY